MKAYASRKFLIALMAVVTLLSQRQWYAAAGAAVAYIFAEAHIDASAATVNHVVHSAEDAVEEFEPELSHMGFAQALDATPADEVPAAEPPTPAVQARLPFGYAGTAHYTQEAS